MQSLIFPLSKNEAKKNKAPYSSEQNKNALFPSRLRELRKAAKLSQEQFSKAIGVTKSTISLYETGDNVPDVKTFVRIADFLEVSYDFLLGHSDTPIREHQDIIEQTKLSKEAISSLTKLDISGREVLNLLLTQEIGADFLRNLHYYLSKNLHLTNSTNDSTQIDGMIFVVDEYEKNHKALTMLNPNDLSDLFFIKLQNNIMKLREGFNDGKYQENRE